MQRCCSTAPRASEGHGHTHGPRCAGHLERLPAFLAQFGGLEAEQASWPLFRLVVRFFFRFSKCFLVFAPPVIFSEFQFSEFVSML